MHMDVCIRAAKAAFAPERFVTSRGRTIVRSTRVKYNQHLRNATEKPGGRFASNSEPNVDVCHETLRFFAPLSRNPKLVFEQAGPVERPSARVNR